MMALEISERERLILLAMLGPDPYRDRLTGKMVSDLAHDFGVTDERLKQIASRMLGRLRA